MATEILSPVLLPALFVAATAALALSGCPVSGDVGGDEERIDTGTVPAAGITTLDVTTENRRIEVSARQVADIEVADIEIATTDHEHEVDDGQQRHGGRR